MTWLDRLKQTETPGPGTDKTARTLLSVLAVPYPGTIEKSQGAAPRLRIVEFRLKVDAPGRWHTALGPDVDELLVDLRERYGERLDGARVKP